MKSFIVAVLVFASVTWAQPWSTPPKPAEFDVVDVNRDGQLNANDHNAFTNKYAVADFWLQDLRTKAPGQPSGLQGVVNGQVVTLTWSNSTKPQTAVYILRNGVMLQTLAGNAVSTTDSPGGGSWVYLVTTGNMVGSFIYPPVGLVPVVSVTVTGAPPTPSQGWTELPATGQVFYVSTSGSDSNPGTQASPFKTLSKGYSALRNNFPDQLLLKRGDTWTEVFPSWRKSAGSTNSYMVVGAYGTGARPKIRSGANQSVIHGGQFVGRGLAIVDLDVQPVSPTSGAAGFGFFDGWEHVLIEGCSIVGYPDNIQMQEVGSGRLRDIKIRRNLIADSANTGAGHSQGIFFGCVDEWVVEENILDNNARAKADMFCHNFYCHETCGRGKFNGNISSRACSHGVQQRPGGEMDDNLFLENPINAYQGGNGANRCAYNVVLDSRNINGVDKRGEGLTLGGGPGSVIEYNTVAHQTLGTEDVIAFNVNGWSGNLIKGNSSYSWFAPSNPGWSVLGFQFEGGSGNFTFTGNKILSNSNGMLVRWESPMRGSYDHNTYATATSDSGVGGYARFATNAGQGASWAVWQGLAGESGSSLTSTTPVLNGTIGGYLVSKNVPVGGNAVVTFLTRARANDKVSWVEDWTPKRVNPWVRGVFGTVAMP